MKPTAGTADPSTRAPGAGRRGTRSTRLRATRSDQADVWDRLARALPGGTPFHLWDFLDLQQRMLGFTVERLLVLAGEVPVGILPVARRSPRSPRAPWAPFPFLGPAVQPRHLPGALRLFRRHQARTGLVLGRFDVAPELAPPALAAAARTSMTARVDGTVVVDLGHGSPEALDAGMGKYRRRDMRRALQAGVAARAAEPGETSRLLGPILRQAYGRRDVASPYPADVGEQVERWAEGRDDVHLGVVEVEGRAVGSLVTLTGHRIAVPWIGSTLDEVRATNAEAVLLRAGMLHAMQRGCVAWDFGGRVDDGVERFKLSFGGRPEPYLTVESFFGPQRLRSALGSVAARRSG